MCVVLPALALALLWTAAAARAADSALSIVPQDALAFGVVHHLAETSAKLKKLGEQVQAPIPDVLDQVKTATGIEKGLDEKGAVVGIVMPGEDSKAEPQAVAAIPVTNYEQFLEQLKPEKKEGGIAQVTLARSSMLVANRGGFALLAEPKHRAALKKVLDSKKGLAGELSGLGPWLPENDLALVATQSGLKLFVGKALEELKKAREMLGNADMGPAGMNFGSIIGIYEGFLKAIEKDVVALALGVRADKQGSIVVDGRARFVAEGGAAAVLAEAKPGDGKQLQGLPGGQFVFALGGSTSKALGERLLAFSLNVMKENSKLYGLTPEQAVKVVEISRESMARMQGFAMEMKVGKRGEPIYGNMYGTIRVDNAEKYLAEYEKQMAAMNDLLKNAKGGLMKPTAVKKVEIEGKPALQMEMVIPIPGADLPGMDKFMDALLGQGGKATIYLTAADERNVVFSYNTAQELLAKAVALVKDSKAGLAADPEIAATAKTLPEGSQWVALVSPRGVVALAARMFAVFSEMAPMGLDIKIPEFPKTPPVGVGVKASAGEVQAQVVVPSEVLQAIGKYQGDVREQRSLPAP
jgi:hypothetical protein